jgi:hypothetical protein
MVDTVAGNHEPTRPAPPAQGFPPHVFVAQASPLGGVVVGIVDVSAVPRNPIPCVALLQAGPAQAFLSTDQCASALRTRAR